jgi:hypothetical protein
MPTVQPSTGIKVTGPIPKRSTTLRRTNKENAAEQVPDKPTKSPYPAADNWTDIVKQIWNALPESGMSRFYTASDWAFGYAVCDALNTASTVVLANIGGVSVNAMLACLTSLSRLGITEGDRRRLRIELQAEAAKNDPRIAILADYRKLQQEAS